MSIKETVKAEMIAAMKAKEKPRLDIIRLIMAEFKRVEVDERIELDETRVLVILDKMLKQRRDSLAQFEQAGRDDLAQQESFEIEIIQSFMPQPLTESEISGLIEEAIRQTGAQSVKDMGKVMAELKPKLQGRADMGKVGSQIKASLDKASA